MYMTSVSEEERKLFTEQMAAQSQAREGGGWGAGWSIYSSWKRKQRALLKVENEQWGCFKMLTQLSSVGGGAAMRSSLR